MRNLRPEICTSPKVLAKCGFLLPVAEVLAITAMFFLAAGGSPPGVNEPHYLSRLKHFWDPAWRPADFFLNSPDAHFTIVLLLGWATRFASLTAVAWAGRLMAWLLLAWAWRRLSWRVAPTAWCSVLTATLWVTLTREANLAGEWVVGGVEAKCFAYGFVLMAMRDALNQRWRPVWPWIGLACAMHALVGLWAGVTLAAVWACFYRDEATPRQLAPPVLFGGLIAMAGVLPPLLMNWGTPAATQAAGNQIYVYERLPHHLALLSMPDDWLADRSLRHLSLLVVLAGLSLVLAKSRPPVAGAWDASALMRLHRIAWAASLFSVAGLAISVLLAHQPAAAAGLLRYYWHRLADVAAPLAVALTLGAGVSRLVGVGHRLAAPALLFLLVVAGQLLWLQIDLQTRAIPPTARRVADYRQWRAACQWAADHTDANALFMVPKHSGTFGWYAGRSEVVTWKNIPQDAAGLVEWRQRIQDLYTRPADEGEPLLVRSLGRLGGDRLRELAGRYGAHYALTTRDRLVSLPIAYQNRTYVVYDLRDSANPTTQPVVP